MEKKMLIIGSGIGHHSPAVALHQAGRHGKEIVLINRDKYLTARERFMNYNWE